MSVKKLLLGGFAALAIISVALTCTNIKTAEAISRYDCNPNGLDCWIGYFSGRKQTGGNDVIVGGIHSGNATDFTNTIAGLLRCNAYPNDANATGASFIVLTMLGAGPGTNKLDACTRFGEWRNRIFEYERDGRINWNENYSYGINTFYQPSYNDIAYYPENGTAPSMTFRDASGRIIYAIRRECANPVGQLSGLPYYPPPPPNWSMSGSASANRADAYPGETVRFYTDLVNNGPDTTSNISFRSEWQYLNGAGQPITGIEGNPPASYAQQVFAPGAHMFGYGVSDVTIPTIIPPGATQLCGWVAWNPASSSNGNWQRSNYACVQVYPATPSCGGTSTIPANPEPSQKFTLKTIITYANARARDSAISTGGQMYVSLTQNSNGNLVFGGYVSYVANGNALESNITNIGPAANAADYTVAYRMDFGSGAGGNCSSQKTIANYPYFNTVGGDIVAGAGFTDGVNDCHVSGAGISSYNNDTFPFYGAGSNLAALAMGSITHFATASNAGNGDSSGVSVNNPIANSSAKNLMFANTSTPGGNYSGMSCMPDFYGDVEDKGTTPLGSTTTSAALASGRYKFPGTSGARIAGGTVATGQQVTIISDGDVFITGNITYASASTTATIPRFTIIAKGNVYIAPNVTELHGVIVAQKKGTVGGTVFTCATASGVPTTRIDTCSNKLTFVGAVGAEKVELRRTGGSLNGTNTTTVSNLGNINATDWFINGSAVISNADLLLTNASSTAKQSGNATSRNTVSSDNLVVNFQMQMGGGTGADGIGIVFLPGTAPGNRLGRDGCGMGYYGLGGTGVVFDTYKNANDPSNNFTGIPDPANVDDGICTGSGWKAKTNLPFSLRSGNHAVRIEVKNRTNMKAFIDGVQYFDATVALPANIRIAVTGGSGSLNDNHIVRNFTAISTTNPGSTVENAAETFQYSPELWMSTGTGAIGGSTAGGLKYDAITSLAPTL